MFFNHYWIKLSNAPLYKRGFWGNQVEIYASEIFNRMSPDEVGDQCDDWYAFGLVHHSANFHAKADWSRKVTYTKLGEQRRGGHRHGYTFFLFKWECAIITLFIQDIHATFLCNLTVSLFFSLCLKCMLMYCTTSQLWIFLNSFSI